MISVTDANGNQQTQGSPYAVPGDPDTLAINVRHLPQGWYLVYWRAISADGHPVRGAFTFAVGPIPGAAPQFVIPSLSESAATPQLVAARWLVFLAMMIAVGLFAFRTADRPPGARRVGGRAPARHGRVRRLLGRRGPAGYPRSTWVTTAEFAQRSVIDVGGVVPLIRDSAFGRASSTSSWCWRCSGWPPLVAIKLDRPDREQRSVAELLALTGALVAAGALLVSRAWPATPGRPRRRRFRSRSTGRIWSRDRCGSAA